MAADTASRPIVAVLGTGIMGLPMARNIARAGMPVRAWNRTADRARALEADGITVVADPAAAIDGADIAVTMLADARAVVETMEQALAGSVRPAVWAQMSTVGIDGAERAAALAARHGVPIVDAPVLGTRQPAEQGALTVIASGPADARERCAPVFDAVATKTIVAGEAPADGQRVKLVLNHWVLALVEATAETVQLAEALGVDPRLWLETIAGGPLDSPYAQSKGRAILERRLDPAFRLSLARKDADLVIDAATAAGLDPALMRVVAERMAAAIQAGHGDEDMAATYFAVATADASAPGSSSVSGPSGP